MSVLPGHRKDWGYYLLSEWRYDLTQKVSGRAYLDYRTKLGWSEGLGLNYTNTAVGSGDIKFYFTDEHPPQNKYADQRDSYQRYLIRLRHKWDIDERTNVIAEFYKIRDEVRKFADSNNNILKEYFYREYEEDSQPLTYAMFHHSFSYSSIDILLQNRNNHWFDQLQKMPEIKYVLPSLQLGESPFYFDNNTIYDTFNKKATMSPTTADDLTVARLDSINRLSLPMRIAFFRVSPFIQVRETIYDKGANGASLPARSIFYTGADVSTKFYRTFEVKSNVLGLDLNGLRHIITPSFGYSYNPEPTVTVEGAFTTKNRPIPTTKINIPLTIATYLLLRKPMDT